MTQYAKVQGASLLKYPYTFADLQEENPYTNYGGNSDFVTIFPLTDPAVQYGYTLVEVTAESMPTFDRSMQVCRQNTAPSLVNGVWMLGWTVEALTAEQLTQYQTSLMDEIGAATQLRLDNFAKTRGYDGILSACTYAASPTPRFAAEGQYCVNARDATWAKLYELLAEVQAGTRPMPAGYADIEALLPALNWPV